MYPLPKDKLVQELKDKFGVSLSLDSDFTKLPDEILANAHLYDWVDKVSIQANVEMSRRLKDAITKMDESAKKANARTERFSLILVLVAILQFLVAWFQLISSVAEMKNQWLGAVLLVGAGGLLVWTVRSIAKRAG